MTGLKVYKKIKQDVEDINKMVYEQNGNIGNEMENLKKKNLELKIIIKRIIH